jgi:hypothetical protein
MNPQEKVQLEQFLLQLNSTQAGAKDSDANALIAESVKQQPDAAYLLVQRAMGLEMALQVAQKQMAEMQAQIDQTSKPSGFLSGINSWGRAAPAQAAPANAMAAARPAAGAAQPSSWGSGMLGAIATTAVGVVAGSMLYQGIQSMMGMVWAIPIPLPIQGSKWLKTTITVPVTTTTTLVVTLIAMGLRNPHSHPV